MTLADRMARFNRRLANPIIRTFAGRRLSPVALVVHRGRNSGRRYRTPVLAVPVGEGYVVSLPYGADRDWVRNVLAAGGCTLHRSGRQLQLTRPSLLTGREAVALAPAWLRPALRPLSGIRLLRLWPAF
jgi:deazaflavin-dependent oxidoreductase (nitroreductase family)